jgi:hypothetical protein
LEDGSFTFLTGDACVAALHVVDGGCFDVTVGWVGAAHAVVAAGEAVRPAVLQWARGGGGCGGGCASLDGSKGYVGGGAGAGSGLIGLLGSIDVGLVFGGEVGAVVAGSFGSCLAEALFVGTVEMGLHVA